jgi:cell shape-determining protein MreC
MMMISSSRRKKGISFGTYAAIVGVILVLVIVGVWRESAAALLMKVSAPVWELRAALGHGEIAQLKERLSVLENKVADRDVLYEENLALKARLGRDASVERILAGVIMRPPGTPYDTLLIDAGSAEGIAVGQRVSAGGTTRIGVISEVYEHTARVELFSAPGFSYEGLIRGEVPISVEGQGGGSLRGEVPEGAVLSVGDPVVLSGIAGGYSSRVSYIEHTEGRSLKEVFMQLPVNLFELSYVEVWKNENE